VPASLPSRLSPESRHTMAQSKKKMAGGKKTGTFKPQIVFPMYPYRNPVGAAGTCLALTPEAANIPQYVLDKDDIAILKSATPEVFVRDSDGRTKIDFARLEGILIGEYNIRPADTKDLSLQQILSMLKVVQRKKGDTGVKAEIPQSIKTNEGQKDTMSKEACVLAVLQDHPGWTNMQIAKVAGVHKKSLSRWDNFRKAREILKTGKLDIPKGNKDTETGDIEAWQK